MVEPLETFFLAELVRRLADDVARVEPRFDDTAFVDAASAGLDDLELLDRCC